MEYTLYCCDAFDTELVNQFYDDFTEGYHYIYKFANGYGASVVKHSFSYGHEQDFWELAVTKYDESGNWDICYSTPITSDVLGYLSDEEVYETLKSINSLYPDVD